MDNEENFRQFTELLLGISDIEIELQSRAETSHATELMVQQCEENLEIFTRDLDAPLYDQEAFLQALGALCLRNRKARVRILVQDPVPPVKRGHRLIELARRLSSSIELRQPHPDYRQHNEAFLIADRCGFIQRSLADRYEGTANFYNPVVAGRKLDFFIEVWERSEAHPEFRRLHI
jgi:phosphatidylserine/phosphatidylglycerophosphate/cardiolipin synthase-like enzyme